jgi:hypothetical protein
VFTKLGIIKDYFAKICQKCDQKGKICCENDRFCIFVKICAQMQKMNIFVSTLIYTCQPQPRHEKSARRKIHANSNIFKKTLCPQHFRLFKIIYWWAKSLKNCAKYHEDMAGFWFWFLPPVVVPGWNGRFLQLLIQLWVPVLKASNPHPTAGLYYRLQKSKHLKTRLYFWLQQSKPLKWL